MGRTLSAEEQAGGSAPDPQWSRAYWHSQSRPVNQRPRFCERGTRSQFSDIGLPLEVEK
jgi:hypothetical protein